MARLLQMWVNLRSSLWFLPGLIVLGAIGLAVILINAEALVGDEALSRWPRLFGAGAEGSRGLLVAVAGSMITVAGLVFSITVVAITLAASLYSSRVLRNFMRDKANQTVLGVFVGVFAYCLIVVRTIRGGNEDAFVPSLAVFGGLILALVGIAFLIFFIHHITLSIQVAQILAVVCADARKAIDSLYPDPDRLPSADDTFDFPGEEPWHRVCADRSGYVQRIDTDGLIALARERQWVVRAEKSVGDFLIEGLPALSVRAPEAPDAELEASLMAAISVGRQRTVEQDPGFAIRQIVDIALKALSPGVNDTTTAAMCLDYLTVILLHLGERHVGCAYRDEEGAVRLLTCGPTFESLLGEALEQIRQNADGNVTVMRALLRCLETLASRFPLKHRRDGVLRQGLAVREAVRRTVPAPSDLQRLEEQCARLMTQLEKNP